ncbi:autotransporter outer membrane beta-barrel domain-containing protein [Mesorhizobium marinum]|uniref:autotransporter outer membrane beta-barrel domain-containing protein n=1 Tax=Mesorhizobium marinum TaxID=3228790 RepID=UPI0034654148
MRTVAGVETRCIDPRDATTEDQARWPVCPDEMLAEAVDVSEAPLTDGRDLLEPSLWNAWAQPLAVQVFDERYGLDMETRLAGVTVGLDRRFGDNVVFGATFAMSDTSTDGFDSLFEAGSDGFAFGPYLAIRLSPNWVLDTSLTYGLYDNDLLLAVLEGDYDSQVWTGNVTAYGQYALGEYFVRPKASVTYGHVDTDAYHLKGEVLNVPISVAFPDDSFNFGVAELTAEFSRIYSFENGMTVMPYAEFGAVYEFDRPSDGQILTADLDLVTPSAWTGTLRAGARMQLSDTVQVEASGGYLSLGQNDLDIWEGKFLVSFGF